MEIKNRVTLVSSCMFAGKSAYLIEELKKLKLEQEELLAIKPRCHTRDGEYIKSRAYPDEVISCQFVETTEEFETLIKSNPKSKVVIIDEIAFLPIGVAKIIEESDKTFIIAGLDMDFKKQPFQTTEAVEKIANKVIKPTANCSICSKPARFTSLISGNKNKSVQIEGEGVSYQPRCLNHWE